MTLFGPDVSHWQSGIVVDPDDLAAVAFAMARASIGTRTDDAHRVAYPVARSAGIGYAAYHFVYPTRSHAAGDQAAAFDRSVGGDTDVSVMLDVEHDGDMSPDWGDTLAVADAIRAYGYRVTLVYLPRWYWQTIGSPTLAGAGLSLVSSDYGPNTPGEIGDRYAARGGDAGPGWSNYGGVTPTVWQYGSQIEFGNQLVDMNAYRGDPADLGRWFTPPDNTEGDDMQLWAGMDQEGNIWLGDGISRRLIEWGAWNVAVLRAVTGAGPRIYLAGGSGGSVTNPDDVKAVTLDEASGALDSLGAPLADTYG